MQWLLSILAGFVLGKFFTFWFLVVVTVVAIIYCIYLTVTLRRGGLAFLIALVAWQYSVISGIVMWVTYYITTGQNWLSQLAQHVLR